MSSWCATSAVIRHLLWLLLSNQYSWLNNLNMFEDFNVLKLAHSFVCVWGTLEFLCCECTHKNVWMVGVVQLLVPTVICPQTSPEWYTCAHIKTVPELEGGRRKTGGFEAEGVGDTMFRKPKSINLANAWNMFRLPWVGRLTQQRYSFPPVLGQGSGGHCCSCTR